LKKIVVFLALLISALICPVLAAEERPVNFIFLIDVSGSMVLKSTMVTAADGTQVTLFEALRQALKQVAEDPRLINPKSRISFLTFGTKITDKTDWPSKLERSDDRQALLKVIQSPEALSADKHGDTYMGGALALALQKANQMYSEADPCTTTFIVMLTDGWDEPPAGATIKVRDVANDLTTKQKQIFKKVGIKTWKVLVIGLQRLPDKKAGTTTAKELANLLGGEFIDVTKQSGGTVSQRIFLALKSQVEQLKGQLTLGSGKSLKSGVVDFGTVVGNGSAKASFPLELKSCYAEEISGLKDVTAAIAPPKLKALLGTAASVTGGACQSVSTIPADAITLHIAPTQIAPASGEQGDRSLTSMDISVDAQAHSNCPAGHYAGCFKLDSTAKVPDYIGWTLLVPGRVVADPETIKVKMRKPGFLWAEDSDVDLVGKLKELPGAHAQANYDVEILPHRATRIESKKGDAISSDNISEAEMNGGKPLSFALDTAKTDSHEFKLNVAIKANQKPGKYAGILGIKISGPAETVAPSEIPFEISVEPSAWEEVAPIAIPILFVLVLSTVFGLFLWVTNMKRD
jgi:hypothetical protein